MLAKAPLNTNIRLCGNCDDESPYLCAKKFAEAAVDEYAQRIFTIYG